MRSSLLIYIIPGVYVLNFWPKCVLVEQLQPRYCPLWDNSSHHDNHILSPAPGNSSHNLCMQLPTLPWGGNSSRHHCFQFPPSGQLPNTFLVFKDIFHFSVSHAYLVETPFSKKTTIIFPNAHISFVFGLHTSYRRYKFINTLIDFL